MKKGMLMWICYILCLLMAGCMEPEVYSTRDITEYRKFEGHISKEKNDIFSGLKIFPTELNENMKQISYYYECGNYALDNNYLIYFECEWEDANFADEIGRLKDLSLTYGEQTKKIIYEEVGFRYPAYVSIYDEDMLNMEYALIDEKNNRIIYLFSQLNGDLSKKINGEYLKKENINFNSSLLKKGYNMYFFEIGDGQGEYIK